MKKRPMRWASSCELCRGCGATHGSGCFRAWTQLARAKMPEEKRVPNKAQDDDLVMSLVELALARPREERDSYIDSACSGDPGLIGEVRKYVGWEERMNGFLLDPLYAPQDLEQPFESGELLGGRFRIVREVDEGGMGIVYEAVDEKLERRIAIKCAKSGFRKRLPPEVRHASEIAHPNICKIHEIHTASTEHDEVDFLTM